jgi:hypothetical protein
MQDLPLNGQKQNGKEVSQIQYARLAENPDVLANRIPHASRRPNQAEILQLSFLQRLLPSERGGLGYSVACAAVGGSAAH